MLECPICFSRAAVLVAVAVAASVSACGGPTQPSTPPTDPPKISCPAPVTQQSVDANPVPVTFTDPTVAGGQPPLTVACTPVSGSMFQVGATPVTCTATDAQRRADTCSFSVTVVVPPKPMIKFTRFVAFGDSITWGENGTNFSVLDTGRSRPFVQFPSFQTYPGALQQLLGGRYTTQSVSVANEGQPGESVTVLHTGDVPAPSRFSSVIAGNRYDVALIMEGANDLSDRDSKIDPAVIAGLRQMILDAKSRQMTVYLATIPPENSAAPCCRALGWSLVPGLNDQIRGLAVEQGIPLVDVYAALNDVNTYIGPDGLHPTADGYAKIADTFFQVIKQTLETTQSLTPSAFGGARMRPGTAAPLPSSRPPQPAVRKPR
jgi:lysophospholipase L1-like esterase